MLSALDATSFSSLRSLVIFLVHELNNNEPVHRDGDSLPRDYFVFGVQARGNGPPLLEVGWGSPHAVELHSIAAVLPAHAERWLDVASRLEIAGVISGPVGAVNAPRFWVRPALLLRLERIVVA